MSDDISMKTLSAAEDYYTDLMASLEGTRCTLAPALQFAMQIAPTYLGMASLYVKEIRSSSNALIYIRFILVPKKTNKTDEKFLGNMTVQSFSSLEETLETALSEYRRKNFKKVSRRQRHMEVAHGD
jgi:hypothetical protein